MQKVLHICKDYKKNEKESEIIIIILDTFILCVSFLRDTGKWDVMVIAFIQSMCIYVHISL